MEPTVINTIVLITLTAFLLNIPLGVWRGGAKKFGVRWFVAIHLAVPVIYYLRVSTGTSAWMIPVLIAFAVLGQIVGNSIYKKRQIMKGLYTAPVEN